MSKAGLKQAIPVFRLAEIVTPHIQQASFGSDKKPHRKSELLQYSFSVLLTADNHFTGLSKMHNSM
jgi:hypothetical protein